jgi:hypothetical protein
MDFGKLFTRAWEIIWNNKILWLFGLLASCTSGYGRGGGNFNFSGSSRRDFTGDLENFNPGQMPPFFRDIERFFDRLINGDESTILLIVVGLVLLGLLFAILSFVVGNYGRVALIKGAQTAELEGTKLTFGDLHQMGMSRLTPALLLNFVVGLVLFVIVGIFVAVGILGTVLTLGIGLLCFIPLICILIPVAWAFGIVMMNANIALVTEELNPMDALRRGVEVLRAKPGVLVGMYFVVLFGAGIVSLVLAIPYFLAVVPTIIAAIADPGVTQTLGAGVIVSIAIACVYTPVMLLGSSILVSFVYALLTLVYMDVTSAMPALGEGKDALAARAGD